MPNFGGTSPYTGLSPAAIKTAGYTAAPGEMVPGDTTTAGFTVTLPASPTVGAQVGVYKVDSTANVLTILPAGTGTIDGDANAQCLTKNAGATVEHLGGDAWKTVSLYSAAGAAGYLRTSEASSTYALLQRPNSIPSTVALASAYEKKTALYGVTATSFNRFRAALARGRAGGRPTRILCGGDSITHGLFSDAPLFQNSYPVRLRTLLNNFWGQPTADGTIWPNQDGSFDDTRITLGTGWATIGGKFNTAASGSSGLGGGGVWQGPAGSAQTLTFTPGGTTDTFVIYFLDIFQGGTHSGTFLYNLNGGTQQNVTMTATSGNTLIRSVTISATRGANVLNITPAGGGAATFIAGVEAYDSTVRPVLVSGQGVAGVNTTWWNNPTSIYGDSPDILKAYAPDLFICFLGMNDARTDALAVTPSAYQTNLAALVTAVRQNNGDVLFVAPYTSDASGQGSAQAYVQAQYAVADASDVAVFDLASFWPAIGSLVAAPYSYLYSDRIHPVSAGYYAIAEGLFAALRQAV